MLEKWFKLKENNTNFRTELVAGFTTFFTMAYIIFVNPNILAQAGMPAGSVMVATCLAAALGTILIGLLSNYPFAQAPGMGLNAFFVYTMILGLGWEWQGALGAVFIAGIIFLIITFTGIRGKIVNAIPMSLKYAITAGIGLFIATIGLKGSTTAAGTPWGIVSVSDAGLFLGNLGSPEVILCLVGLLIIIILMALKVKGALLIGIIASTIIGLFIPNSDGTGMITSLSGVVSIYSILALAFFALLVLSVVLWVLSKKNAFKFLAGGSLVGVIAMLVILIVIGDSQMDFSTFAALDFTKMFPGGISATSIIGFITVLLALTMIDMFDTIGTLVGTSAKAGYLDKDGNLPKVNKALAADAIATSAGAVMGTSTVTTYIESVAGVNEGGRTGLTSMVVAVLFILALVFTPIAGIIPAAATYPALIIVGILMMSSVKKIEWDDFSEAAPAFFTILVMPLTTSITDGIAFGFVTYCICKLFKGEGKKVSALLYVLAVIFIAYFVLKTIIGV